MEDNSDVLNPDSDDVFDEKLTDEEAEKENYSEDIGGEDMSMDMSMDVSMGGEDVAIGGNMIGGNMIGGSDDLYSGETSGSTVKDPVLSSIPFVASTISVALVIGIVLGILLGKKRIKKGFDSYEN